MIRSRLSLLLLAVIAGDAYAAEPSATATPAPVVAGTSPSAVPSAVPSAGATPATPSVAATVHPPLPGHGAGAAGAPALDHILGLVGSPFASDEHRMLAALVRRGHNAQPASQVIPTAEVEPGTIGILVQDGKRQPVANTRVVLRGVKQDIEEGDKHFTHETTTDDQGRAAFRGQETDTSYNYEVVVERDGATYTSGSFGFDHGKGAIVSLYVFPVVADLNATLVFTRALYAIEPRSDVFAVQALYRFQNAGAAAWQANAFPIRLPAQASAFQPGNASGVELREERGSVLVTGSFPPGQKEFSFAFQLPNPRTESVELRLPAPPHLADAKVVVESSQQMGLTVSGFNPAQRTQAADGQAALLADQDFLQRSGHAPTEITALVSGIPGKSQAPLYAVLLASLVALTGLYHALSNRPNTKRALMSDQEAARAVILDELLQLEDAFRTEKVGPKTYDRTRRLLLDALARLDAGPLQPSAEHASGT